MTFNEYVIDWWKDYLSSIDESTAKRIMENEFTGEEETVEDYIPEDAESVIDWLDNQDDDGEKFTRFSSALRLQTACTTTSQILTCSSQICLCTALVGITTRIARQSPALLKVL